MVNNCLRYILKVWWPNKIINVDLWRHMNQEQVHDEVKSGKWGWIDQYSKECPGLQPARQEEARETRK